MHMADQTCTSGKVLIPEEKAEFVLDAADWSCAVVGPGCPEADNLDRGLWPGSRGLIGKPNPIARSGGRCMKWADRRRPCARAGPGAGPEAHTGRRNGAPRAAARPDS